jgi:hypothetical protein
MVRDINAMMLYFSICMLAAWCQILTVFCWFFQQHMLEVFTVISFLGNVARRRGHPRARHPEGCKLAVPDVGTMKDGREAEGRRQQWL